MPEFFFKLSERNEHSVRIRYSQLNKTLKMFYDEKPYFSCNITGSNLIKLWIGEDLLELRVKVAFSYVPPVVEVRLNGKTIERTKT